MSRPSATAASPGPNRRHAAAATSPGAASAWNGLPATWRPAAITNTEWLPATVTMYVACVRTGRVSGSALGLVL